MGLDDGISAFDGVLYVVAKPVSATRESFSDHRN